MIEEDKTEEPADLGPGAEGYGALEQQDVAQPDMHEKAQQLQASAAEMGKRADAEPNADEAAYLRRLAGLAGQAAKFYDGLAGGHGNQNANLLSWDDSPEAERLVKDVISMLGAQEARASAEPRTVWEETRLIFDADTPYVKVS